MAVKKRPAVIKDPPRVLKNRVRFYVIFFGLLLLAASLYSFLRSDYFAVTAVEVEGNDRLTDETIISATGIEPGVNIWQVDIRRLESNLKKNRRIRSVFVRKELPDIVSIQIEEYKPLVLMVSTKGFVEVDENRAVVGFPLSITDKGLPILTGIPVEDLSVGDEVTGDHLLLGFAFAEIVHHDPGLGIQEIHLTDAGDVVLITKESIRILMGSVKENVVGRMDILRPILVDVRESGIQVSQIDMRVPEKPVVKTR